MGEFSFDRIIFLLWHTVWNYTTILLIQFIFKLNEEKRPKKKLSLDTMMLSNRQTRLVSIIFHAIHYLIRVIVNFKDM